VKKILSGYDWFVDKTGELVKWLAVILVLQMSFEVTMRYLFNAPTIWGYDTAVMTGIALYIIAWSYADLHNQHVRVDIVYVRLSAKGKAIIDMLGAIFFFLPFVATMLYTSSTWMWKAWATHEVRSETYWYPPAAPIRTLFFLGVILFTFRGLTRLIRDVYLVVRSKPL
jgi:TRAP-type mannitol/chloroaromatic compound transport system permease small subunit